MDLGAAEFAAGLAGTGPSQAFPLSALEFKAIADAFLSSFPLFLPPCVDTATPSYTEVSALPGQGVGTKVVRIPWLSCFSLESLIQHRMG